GVREPAGEFVVAKERIGDTLGLSAGQPGGDKGVAIGQHAFDKQGPAGHQDDDDLFALVTNAGDKIDFRLAQGEIGAVALAFGIGPLGEHDDAYVGYDGIAGIVD